MKSNQERSNECLPPKKREILAMEEKQVLVSAAASESQSGENLAWLASVATMASMAQIPNNAGPLRSNSNEPDSPPPSNKACTVVMEYPPVTTSAGFSFPSNSSMYRDVFSGPTVLTANSAVLSTSLHQTIGSVQYTQLPPNLQLIGPYTSYISSQIMPSTCSPTQPRRSPQEVLTTSAGISQASSIQNLGLQTQAQVLLPADYTSHDRAGLQTSLMLVSSSHLAANSNPELQSILGKDHPSLNLAESGGIYLRKPMSRVSTLTSSGSQVSPASTLFPHTLLQAPHNTPQQELSTSLYSATQLPIIGYITNAPSGSQQAVAGYQSNLPQHVVISGSPSLLIPVSATNFNPSTTEPEVIRCSVIPSAATASAALPQTFINTGPATASVLPNGQDITGSDGIHAPSAMQSPNQAQLPVLSASVVGSPVPLTPPASSSPHSSPSSPSASLPPFFMKGSIIQMADGELKRVEDLQTEDFVQSAEVSGELKLDSSTVERIEFSHSPNAVIIQFSVGENKAQVCVEVLMEYPFFVFGQGWSSCCPDRTTQLLALSCAKLSVGDVCISLTLKSLKNCPLKKDPFSDSILKPNPHLKGTKSNGLTEERPTQVSDLKGDCKITSGEENNVAGTLVETPKPGNILTLSENGGINPQKTYTSGADRAVCRKRRWSAPERGEMRRSQEDHQILPKFSFLPHQLKVSIEGHSSTGC
ncbi:ataxin-1-like [Xyrauchen texanus]|uniref:ataxin-1-like n=1 Tax=Xyrauchen texanus TaxID=154827 RepID=UPI00224223DF|nr:ataxin-1-like [Xyrauchen texanus]XP_052002812.1 ataxin-1-like [Xyrauchen texanus]